MHHQLMRIMLLMKKIMKKKDKKIKKLFQNTFNDSESPNRRMKKISFSAPILTLLPALAFLPVFSEILIGIHMGGLNILFEFFKAK